ncbi:MAG: hypothetical protein QM538_00005, partial [Methylacidiphilales bacterium]|nr:hypothetical protein [Candidatus Methylacidiphilales bacterium]
TSGASGTISLTATAGSIGSSTNPIIIERTSGNWTSSNLTLKATNGSLFIKTASTGALSALTDATPSITFLPTGTFSLEQTIGDITLTNSINLPNSTVIIKTFGTNASINLQSYSITASVVSLSALNSIHYFPNSSASIQITASSIKLTAKTIATYSYPLNLDMLNTIGNKYIYIFSSYVYFGKIIGRGDLFINADSPNADSTNADSPVPSNQNVKLSVQEVGNSDSALRFNNIMIGSSGSSGSSSSSSVQSISNGHCAEDSRGRVLNFDESNCVNSKPFYKVANFNFNDTLKIYTSSYIGTETKALYIDFDAVNKRHKLAPNDVLVTASSGLEAYLYANTSILDQQNDIRKAIADGYIVITNFSTIAVPNFNIVLTFPIVYVQVEPPQEIALFKVSDEPIQTCPDQALSEQAYLELKKLNIPGCEDSLRIASADANRVDSSELKNNSVNVTLPSPTPPTIPLTTSEEPQNLAPSSAPATSQGK